MQGNEPAIPQLSESELLRTALRHYQTYRLNDRHWGKLQGKTQENLEKTWGKAVESLDTERTSGAAGRMEGWLATSPGEVRPRAPHQRSPLQDPSTQSTRLS